MRKDGIICHKACDKVISTNSGIFETAVLVFLTKIYPYLLSKYQGDQFLKYILIYKADLTIFSVSSPAAGEPNQ